MTSKPFYNHCITIDGKMLFGLLARFPSPKKQFIPCWDFNQPVQYISYCLSMYFKTTWLQELKNYVKCILKKLFFQIALVFIDLFYRYYYIRYFIYSDSMWHHVCTICNSIIFTQPTARKLYFSMKSFFSVDHGSS